MNKGHIHLPTLKEYPGGKGSVYQTIINQIPAHNCYLEGYLGAGSVLRNIRPAARTIGIEASADTLGHWQNRLHSIPMKLELYHSLFLEVIAQLDLPKDTFIYLDPPYPIESRKKKHRIYKYEMTNEQHIELLNFIKKLPFSVAISSYPNRLYTEHLVGWRAIEFLAQTRQGMALEVLYMNYEEPKLLHDYSFYGSNKTKRQNFKRRKEKLFNKFEQMNVQERNYYLQELNRVYASPQG
ncbi:MAG: DNA adenine methylase [Bacteroidota bacterium]